jgi:hypothetical protein
MPITPVHFPGGDSPFPPALAVDTVTGANYLAWTNNPLGVFLSSAVVPVNQTVQLEYQWTSVLQVPNAQSFAGPALTDFKQAVWVAWLQVDNFLLEGLGAIPPGGTEIRVASHSAAGWSASVAIPDAKSALAATLVGTPTTLYIFWLEPGAAGTISWSKSADGQHWSAKQSVTAATTNDTPSACLGANGTVHLAWKDRATARVMFSSFEGGATWTAPIAIPGAASPSGPAIAPTVVGEVVVAWRGVTDVSLRYTTFDPSSGHWGAVHLVADTGTGSRPALAPFTLLAAWNGIGSSSLSLFAGPLLALDKSAPATAAAQTYRFNLDSFQILHTRARHEDTDFAFLTVAVGGKPPITLPQSMGNLNNGVYPTVLSLPTQIADNQPAILIYTIINSGNSDPSTFQTTVKNGLITLGDTALTAATKALVNGTLDTFFSKFGDLIGSGVDSFVDNAIAPLAKWLATEVADLIFPDCDGVVAAGVHPFTGAQLRAATAGGNVVRRSDPNPGTDSPDGCGGNSNYVANWSIACVS